jgi:hypothetical protein
VFIDPPSSASQAGQYDTPDEIPLGYKEKGNDRHDRHRFYLSANENTHYRLVKRVGQPA